MSKSSMKADTDQAAGDEKRGDDDERRTSRDAEDEHQREQNVAPEFVRQRPERIIDLPACRIREDTWNRKGHALHEHQQVVDDVGNVRREILIVAMPQEGRHRTDHQDEGEVGKDAEEACRNETYPAG